ncbi:O-antigen ligase family protein [Pelistega suis]|uniref:O-antigen ligase family protein n=1 Tax=Pelistega suis TaxID=1631957 RepID=A0A849NZ02_9BURK|nr:O-antigen ligase family protein [Pelistega suis]NOL50799.1 O-antigen ligase family protein [Pelistega suis]
MFPTIKFNASFFIHLALFILFSLGMVIPKGYSWGVGLLLVTALYIVLRYRKEIDFKSEKSLVYMLLAYVLVSVSVNLIAGHSGRDYELDAKVFLTIPILYALVYRGFNRNYLILAFGLGGVAMGLDSIYEFYVLKVPRVGLYPIRYGYIAAWLAVASLISLIFFAKTSRVFIRVVLVLGILGGVTAAILSGARGSWLFFIVACCLLTVYGCFYTQGKTKILLLSILASCFMAMLVIGLTDNPIFQRVGHAVAEVQKYKPNDPSAGTSLGMRLELFRLSEEIIREHPILGIGTDEFRGKIVQFVQEGKAQPYMTALKHTHNDFVDKAVKTGLISAVAMMLFLCLYPFIFFVKRIRHPHQDIRYYALMGSLLVIAWVEFGMTNIFLTTNQGAIYYLVSLAIFWTGIRRVEKGASTG